MSLTLNQQRRYEDQATRFRRLVNRTPRWYLRDIGGQPVVVDGHGEPLFTIHGPWQRDLARFFAHLHYDAYIVLLAMLEAAPGTSLEDDAVRFLDMLHLDVLTEAPQVE